MDEELGEKRSLLLTVEEFARWPVNTGWRRPPRGSSSTMTPTFGATCSSTSATSKRSRGGVSRLVAAVWISGQSTELSQRRRRTRRRIGGSVERWPSVHPLGIGISSSLNCSSKVPFCSIFVNWV